jgi:hypothetical protein
MQANQGKLPPLLDTRSCVLCCSCTVVAAAAGCEEPTATADGMAELLVGWSNSSTTAAAALQSRDAD